LNRWAVALAFGAAAGAAVAAAVDSSPTTERKPLPLLMCPNCNDGMQEVQRNEVQIDVCPKCRGVWLDRGELEKLLHSVREVEAHYERERESWMRQQPTYQP
jgi:Zn-finger nucleic acid-binding protein